jgi:hypothetical protein
MDGTWERVWRAFLISLDEAGKLDWSRTFLDGSFLPAKKAAIVASRQNGMWDRDTTSSYTLS